MPSLKKKKRQKRQFRVGRGIHLVEIQGPSTASCFVGSGDHIFLAHISSPGFLLGAGPSSAFESSLSSVQPVCPLFNPFAPPHPGICFSCPFFFFLFLWTININSSRLVPQGYFSDFSFSLEALVNTQWQLNPGDLPLRPHLPSAPALLSWLRPCNRRHLCCGLPQPQFDIPLPGVSQMSRLLCLKVYCGFCSWRIKSKLVCMCYTWAPALLFQSGSFFVIVL